MNRKKRILVVDDDAELLSMMKLDLESDNAYEVIACSEPLVALEKVITEEFDLVLTDFHMPGMNGGELLEDMKRVKPGLPVFILSIYHDDASIPINIREKADAIIGKPIDHQKLVALIHERVL